MIRPFQWFSSLTQRWAGTFLVLAGVGFGAKVLMMTAGPPLLAHAVPNAVIKARLAESLSPFTGTTLAVGDIRLEPTLLAGVKASLIAPALRLDGRLLAQAKRVEAYVPYTELLQQRYGLKRIVVEAPDVRLSRQALDLWLSQTAPADNVLVPGATVEARQYTLTVPARLVDPTGHTLLDQLQLAGPRLKWSKIGVDQPNRVQLKGKLTTRLADGRHLQDTVALNSRFKLYGWPLIQFGPSRLSLNGNQALLDWSGQVALPNNSGRSGSFGSPTPAFMLALDGRFNHLGWASDRLTAWWPGWRIHAEKQGRVRLNLIKTDLLTASPAVEGTLEAKNTQLAFWGSPNPAIQAMSGTLHVGPNDISLNQWRLTLPDSPQHNTLTLSAQALHQAGATPLAGDTPALVQSLTQSLTQPLTTMAASLKTRQLDLSQVHRSLLGAWPVLPDTLKTHLMTAAWTGRLDADGLISTRHPTTKAAPNTPDMWHAKGQATLHHLTLYDARQLHWLAPLLTLDGQVAFNPNGDNTVALTTRFAGDTQHGLQLKGGVDVARQQLNRLDVHSDKLPVAGLVRIARAIGLSPKQLPLTDPGGQVTANLVLDGPWRQPNAFGTITLHDIHASLGPLRGMPLSQWSGQLQFDKAQAKLANVNGRLNQLPVSLAGWINHQTRAYDLNLVANSLPLSQVVETLNHLEILPDWSASLPLSQVDDDTLLVEAPKPTSSSLAQTGAHDEAQAGVTSAVSFLESTGAFAGEQLAVEALKHPSGRKAAPVFNAPLLKKMSIHSGTVDINAHLASANPGKLHGQVGVKNVNLSWPGPEKAIPVSITHLTYDLGSGQLAAAPHQGIEVLGIPMQLDGYVRPDDYNLTVGLDHLDVAWLRDNQSAIQTLLPWFSPTIYQAKGSLSGRLALRPDQSNVNLDFHDAGVSVAELKFPLYHVNGSLSVTTTSHGQWLVESDDLAFKYGNSPIDIYSHINGKEDIYLEVSGIISPLLINEVVYTTNNNLLAYTRLPFEINASGKLGELKGDGRGNDLSVFFDFNPTSILAPPSQPPASPATDAASSGNGNGSGTSSGTSSPAKRKTTQVVNTGEDIHWSSVLRLKDNRLIMEKTAFGPPNKNQLVLTGAVNNLFRPLEATVELAAKTTPKLDLAIIDDYLDIPAFDGMKGALTSDITLNASLDQTTVTGSLELDHMAAAGMNLLELTGKVLFDGTQGRVDLTQFRIPGVQLSATGQLPQLGLLPVPISQVKATSDQFIVPLLTMWLDNVVNKQFMQGLFNQFFPTYNQQLPLPAEIESGTVAVKELIIDNLIVTNFTSNLRMYANAFIELEDFAGESAGGKVTGNYAIHPQQNNFMTAHLVIDDMKANAVMSTLLNVTNELFGDLRGTIDFTTQGTSHDELMNHVNGYAELHIAEGRLPSVNNVRKLLVTANTIAGGLANFNLNSLFNFVDPLNSDYTAEIGGIFKIADGLIHTNDVTINGDDLDLFARGNTRLVDGYADLTLNGKLNRDVEGTFGQLGKLSIGRVLGVIPGARKLISIIPGIGYVPGFGGPKLKGGVAFEMDVKGPVDKPTSLQNFRWAR
ncbi:MAG: hypothetical protein KC475_05610 [Cyanobacteria bacterium HKST-UBA03]|nr:hypothetical protein [Cyanobacteria bacterium HKST-UBA03]